ncbi:MAG: hypothetical protein JXQ75_13240 [Phycisphaerae bacterium]|nr:hypothetical protein [Phycisphaerae bacterium]
MPARSPTLKGPAKRGPSLLLLVAGLLLPVSGLGCGPEPVQVDLSSTPIRFVIDHKGWPRPFWWPRVTEFAIADGQNDLIWQLESSNPDGELAHRLAFVYGRVPPGFCQVFPASDAVPASLERGQTYYVAAGGPRALYRMAFSPQVEALEIMHPRRQSAPP